jgi:son of sevenless-like protein
MCHFLSEGVLQKHANKRLTERYVFLFDCLIIFTKLNTKRSSVTGPVGDYKLKEKFNIRKIDVADREDTEGCIEVKIRGANYKDSVLYEDLKYSFEIQPRQHPPITVVARSQEEKNQWMAALFSLLNKSMLERLLDSSLKEKQQPLQLPSPDMYRYETFFSRAKNNNFHS